MYGIDISLRFIKPARAGQERHSHRHGTALLCSDRLAWPLYFPDVAFGRATAEFIRKRLVSGREAE
jgi:hypothetical protein